MILIIGYGNPLCGDDGVGQYVAWVVEQHLSANAAQQVEVLARHQLTPELTEPVSRADLVIFIDAEVGDAPGHIICRSIDQPDQASAFTHKLSPEMLLSGARALYGTLPKAFLVSIIGASFDLGEGLSPLVLAAMPDVLILIQKLLITGLKHPVVQYQTHVWGG